MLSNTEIDLTGSSVLIVDDQPLSIKLMEALLNQKGFVTASAKTGQEALEYLEENTPDLVMLDVMMPGMSGFEVSQMMRKNSKTEDIPIIFVTARDDAETISKCFEAGGNDYAAKPLRIYELLARVKLALTSSLHKKRAQKSEEALEESKAFLKGIIDENPAQIFVMNSEERFLITNKKFADILQLTAEQLNGKTLQEMPEDRKAAHLHRLTKDSGIALRDRKTRHSFEMSYTDSEGDEHWLICTRVPFVFHNEDCVLGINLDFTDMKRTELENKKLEDQLAQSQKMEVIGTLAGGIAHDFNNMLAVILGYADLAKNTLPKDAKQINHLNEVLKAGTRAKDLVRQILNFSRQTEIEHVDFSITSIVKEVLKMVNSTLPSNITSDIDMGNVECFIKGDQTQMHQVFMNLCVNANQAMPQGGNLNVKITDLHLNNCPCCNERMIGKFVHVSVSDTGTGMSENIRNRIFEPFYTTKDVGKGTGMGLAVVHGIIKQHKGHICVDSAEGKGSTFNVFLPATHSDPVEEVTSEDVEYLGKERILVVDDEPMVAELMKDTLELHGYKITMHSDSEKALEEFEKSPESFDLILTDYMMPNLNGAQLAEKIRQIDSKIPIVLATGFSNNITKENAATMGITSFLMKPVIGDDLCKAIQETLGKTSKL